MRNISQLISFFKAAKKSRRIESFIVLMSVLITAVLEVVSIGAVIPLISLMVSPEGADTETFIDFISVFEFLGFETKSLSLPLIINIFCMIVCLTILIRLGSLFLLTRLVNNIGFDLTNRVYKNLIFQDFKFHTNTNSGEIISIINKVQLLTGGIVSPIIQGVSSIIIATGIIISLIVINWKIALSTFIILSISYLIISWVSQKVLRSNSKIINNAHTQRIKKIQDSLGNIREVILRNLQKEFFSDFRETEQNLKFGTISNAVISAAPRSIIEGIGIISLILVSYFFSIRSGDFQTVLPSLAAFAFASQKLLPALQSIYLAWSRVMGNIAVLSDVNQYLHFPHADFHDDISSSFSFQSSIELTNVDYSYDNVSKVLDTASLHIKKGELVGVIGETGSGKSTLIDLLLGLLRPTSGILKVDGRPISDDLLPLWFNLVTCVPQEIYLMDGSITSNIAIGQKADEIDMDRLEKAINSAQLGTLVRDLNQGYEYRIGERGAKLSGGQRQRIGLARALYSGRELLVLDEATSALDKETEMKIFRAIKDLRPKVTIIMISHDVESLGFCDRLIRVADKKLELIRD